MFGKNLKKIRSVRGLSQQEFAEIFDLKRGTLGAYEEGRSNPKLDTVLKIANYFSIGIEELLTQELTVNRLIKFNESITTGSGHSIPTFEDVPCITERYKNDFIKDYPKHFSLAKLPQLHLPHVSGNNLLAFVVDDLSMSEGSNGLFPKDTVIGSLIALDGFSNLNGDLVLIACKENLYLRKIYWRDTHFLLQSNHPSFEELSVPMAKVVGIWKIAHVFHYAIPVRNNLLEDRLAQIEATMAHLNQNKK